MGVPLPSYDLGGFGEVNRKAQSRVSALAAFDFCKPLRQGLDQSAAGYCFSQLDARDFDVQDLFVKADALFSDLLRQWQKDEISETEMIIRFAAWSSEFRLAISKIRKSKTSIPGARALVACVPNESHFVLPQLSSEVLAHEGYDVTYCIGCGEKDLLEKISRFRGGLIVLNSSPVFAREHQADRIGQLVSRIRKKVSSASRIVLVGRFARASQAHLSAANFDYYCETALELPSVASSTSKKN